MINTLYEIFDYYNEKLFDNRLEKVVITIQSKGRLNADGWFTPGKIWKGVSEEAKDKHEINVSAEGLHKGEGAIITTLLHEMVHLYCHQLGIQDTSRQGRFHNKNFRNMADKCGLVCIEDTSIGTITPKLKDNEINNYIVDKVIESKVFLHSRKNFTNGQSGKNKPKKSTLIYSCKSCGAVKKFTATEDFEIVDVKVRCLKCYEYMHIKG